MTSPPGNSAHPSQLEPRGLPLRPGKSGLFSQRAVSRDLRPPSRASSQLLTGVWGLPNCTVVTGFCLQRIEVGRSRVVVSSVGWPFPSRGLANQASETEHKVPSGWCLPPGRVPLPCLAAVREGWLFIF